MSTDANDSPYRKSPGMINRIRGMKDVYIFIIILALLLFMLLSMLIAWGAVPSIIASMKAVPEGSVVKPCKDQAYRNGHWTKIECDHPDQVGKAVNEYFVCECKSKSKPAEKEE